MKARKMRGLPYIDKAVLNKVESRKKYKNNIDK